MNKILRNDIILFLLVLLISLALFIFMISKGSEASYVSVYCDDRQAEVLPLDRDCEYSPNGGANVIKIEGGKAYMSYSACPDHSCMKMHSIGKSGGTIVCLPNKIVVKTEKKSKTDITAG